MGQALDLLKDYPVLQFAVFVGAAFIAAVWGQKAIFSEKAVKDKLWLPMRIWNRMFSKEEKLQEQLLAESLHSRLSQARYGDLEHRVKMLESGYEQLQRRERIANGYSDYVVGDRVAIMAMHTQYGWQPDLPPLLSRREWIEKNMPE